jgi:hypothetical protein
MAKKLSKAKAAEILHDGTAHGKPITDKQRRYFGYVANANLGITMQNENNNFTHLPSGFVGSGYNSKNWKSPAWGGQFQMGGSMPGSVGFTYARTGSTPSNGKYSKKTKASAQKGASIFPVESWRKQGYNTADTLQRGTMYRMPYIDQQKLYNTPIPKGVNPNDIGYMTTKLGQESPNDLLRRRFSLPQSFSSDTTYSGVKKTSHINGMELQDGGMVYYQHGQDFKTKGMQDGGMFDVKALKKRNQKRDSVRQTLYDKYPHDYQKVNNGMLDYFQQEQPINDNRGQWAHPGKVTKINSPDITMSNVPYPVLGVSNTGHTQLMQPEGQYKFQGSNVTEYPMGKQDKGQLKKLKQLTDFSNNNNMEQAKNGGNWIQGAVNPKHKGYCTPMTKSTCTPRRKAFAKTMKKHHGFHKDGGTVPYGQNGYQTLDLSQYNTTAPNFGPPQGMAYQPLNLGQQPQSQGSYGNYQAPQLNLDQTDYSLPKKTVAGNIINGVSVIGGVVRGLKMLKAEKKQKQAAEQNFQLSSLAAKASETRPEAVKRKYVRPEDMVIQPDQMFPSTGVGTNYLSGKNGVSVIGEIQNTYAPHTLYDDLGYEPLNESGKKKQFKNGGKKAQWGAIASGIAQSAANSYVQGQVNQYGQAIGASIGSGRLQAAGNAGSQIGSTLGGAVGSFFGPVGGLVGTAVGAIAGGAIDKNGKRINRFNDLSNVNLNKIGLQQGVRNMQTQNSSFMENGGFLSHNWNPQVITKFGDYTAKEVYDVAHEGLHSLRTGGNIRQNTMAMGGELKVHGGGHAESISSNPYLPDNGETVMFRGKSHADGGMPISFGKQPVEVEGGEPAVKLQDGGTGEDNLVVFGNMKIPSYGVNEIGDKDAKGMKFKNYIAKLSEREEKQNKVVNKGLKLINDTDDRDAFDQLKIASGKALLEGGNMKLKLLAEQKQAAGNVQNAILETAHEHNLDSDALAKGKIKKAKNGANMRYAQSGDTGKSNSAAADLNLLNIFGDYKNKISEYITPEQKDEYIKTGHIPTENPNVLKKAFYNQVSTKGSKNYNEWFKEKYSKNKGKVIDSPWGKQLMELAKPSGSEKYVGIKGGEVAPNMDSAPAYHPFTMDEIGPSGSSKVQLENNPSSKTAKDFKFKGFNAGDAFNSLWPYFRPTNQIGLDPNQLAGEYYALSNNTLDPVNAQKYSPLLDQPYDISFQDQLNANQSDFNALQRQTAYNPAAQSILAGQKYAANSNVLGAQFRANQANKAGIYSKNRDTVNDASLKNLALLDQQYVRQAQAKSNTKATAQMALSSIASKIQQNKLENRTLGVYENLYGYRYDDQGRAYNLNGLAQFNIPEVGKDLSVDQLQSLIDQKKKNKAKNGYLVKALK